VPQYALDRRVVDLRAGQDVGTKRRIISLPRITPVCQPEASLLVLLSWLLNVIPEIRTVLIDFVPYLNFVDV
jgi:hypothetical protein